MASTETMVRPPRIKYMSICLLLIEISVGGMASELQRPFLDRNDPPADTLTSWSTGEQNEEHGYSRRSRREVSAGVARYAATIEIYFSNESLAAELQDLLESISIYKPVLWPSINVTRAYVSSVCHVNESVATCTCKNSYICTGNDTAPTCSCNAASFFECCRANKSIEAFPSNPYIGDTLNVTCQFNGDVTNVSWYHNSSTIKLSNETKYTITNTILLVKDINWSDTGNYTCSANMNSDLRNLTTAVNVRSLNITGSADTDAVCNGSITNLTCCSGDSNLFNVTWEMSGPIQITGTESSNNTCHQYTLQPNNSQCPADLSLSVTVYTCKFQGINGAKGEREIKVTYIKEVNESIEASPSNPYIGDTLNVTCQFTGGVSNVSWYHNSSTIKLSNETKYIITNTILRVTDINWSDAGIYNCSANVNSKLRNLTTVVNVRSLNIIGSADTDAVCNGSITNLTCCSGASNLFNVTWEMSGPIQITGTGSSNNTCHTYTLQPNNSQCPPEYSLSVTVYTCKFQGINGANGEREIKVTYIKEANVSIQTNSPVSVGSTLSIDCISDVKIDNATKDANVTWEKDKLADDSLLSAQTNQNITVNNAPKEWSGTYFCTVQQKQVKNTANVTVSIVPLPTLDEILVDPIEISKACNDTQTLKCCFSKNENYTVIFTDSENRTLKETIENITDVEICYIVQHKLECNSTVEKRIKCEVTNKLGSKSFSREMIIRPWVDGLGPGACDATPEGVPPTPNGLNYTTLCNRSGETGNITYTCNNTKWTKNETCVSKRLFNLWLISQYLSNVPQIEKTLPEFLNNLSIVSLREEMDISSSEANIKLLLKIISAVSDPKINATVNVTTTQHYIDAVNVLVQNPTAWENITYLGSRVLRAVEDFTIKIENKNLDTNISNPTVQLQQRTLNPSQTYNADFSLGNLTGNVAINNDALSSSNTTIVSIAYSTMKDILPPKENTSLNGLVISTKIKEKKDYSNFNISLTFKMNNNSLSEPQCVYWDFTLNQSIGWNNKSCSPTIVKDVVTCNCNHLTSFAILMSGTSDLFLEIITYIGVGISIASLVITLIIEFIVWRSVIKNKTSYLRHVCLVNIAVSLLVADIWLMIGAGLEKYPRSDACTAGAFFSFYFYLALFFWMFATGLLLFHRMIFTLQDLRRKTMMITAFSLGYGCPLIIAVVTVASTAPRQVFTSGKFCWLNYEKSESMSFLAFVVPALTIVFINFIIMLVVISKLLRPSVGERHGAEEKFVLVQIAKSVTVLTPLLGLTWGFGLGVVLHPESYVLHVIFAVLNSLQGLFILISTVLLDKKVRNTVKDSISLSNWSTRKTRLRSSSNFSSPSSGLKKRPGPKKGGYNFFKGHSSSNDTSNTYSG